MNAATGLPAPLSTYDAWSGVCPGVATAVRVSSVSMVTLSPSDTLVRANDTCASAGTR